MSKNIVLDDIFDIEDYLDELEEKVPEVHSGTLRIEELSDINTRAAQLVPEYQPTTSGISLQNLIDIKENTIDKDPTPTPEEDIVVKFLYADPFCLEIKRDFDLNDEYWTKVPDTGPAYDAWNPKDDSGISCSLMGHTFTGSDICLYLGYRDNNYKIEVDPDAIDREGLEQTTIKVPITLTFPRGAFLSGTTQSKAVDYSFTFTDDLNGGSYPYKSETIDTSDPTVTCEVDGVIIINDISYEKNNYTLSDNSIFKNQSWEGTITPLIEDEVFTTITFIDKGVSTNYKITPDAGSTGYGFDLLNENDDIIGCVRNPGDSVRVGFIVELPGQELQPK